MESPAITCADVDALLPLVVDGAIDVVSDPGVFDHLARCNDCQEALARHDLVALAIGSGAALPSDEPAPLRVRLSAPLAWASAAALLATLGALGWWIAADRSTSTPVVAQREIIRVISPGDPSREPIYLIRDGDRLDPARLDFPGGADQPAGGSPPRGSVPVGMHY